MTTRMLVACVAGFALLGLAAVGSAGEPASQPAGAASTDPASPKGFAETNWPQFGGPQRDGKSPIKGIRKDWTGGLKKIWEVKGLSPNTCTWSPPSIQGNRLIVLGQHANSAGQKGNTDTVSC